MRIKTYSCVELARGERAAIIDDLEVGESAAFMDAMPESIRGSAYWLANKLQRRFSCYRMRDGRRIKVTRTR